jgi:hypothetical protein
VIGDAADWEEVAVVVDVYLGVEHETCKIPDESC